MKKTLAILTFLSLGFSSAYAQTGAKLEVGADIRAETSSETSSSSINSESEQEASSDYFMKLGDIKGESSTKGGGRISVGDVNGLTLEEKQAFMATVKAHAQVKSQQDLDNFARGILLSDSNASSIEADEEKAKISYKMPARFLGVFKTSIKTEAKVENDREVKVKLPWYSFLYQKLVAAGKIESDIEANLPNTETEVLVSFENRARVLAVLSEVLKARHEATVTAEANAEVVVE